LTDDADILASLYALSDCNNNVVTLDLVMTGLGLNTTVPMSAYHAVEPEPVKKSKPELFCM
jgi:hypothetical protein